MPKILFENVDLLYPVKVHNRPTFKDLIVKTLLRQPIARPKDVKALDQVSFQIDAGECVGIIGRNGAGKSTLLRTIAKVFPIVDGRRHVNGNVCTLFDIAAGFEWNATGWENIALRAYLQGETPATLKSKLGPIAAFTELGETLDLPLKCYSTGMIMLLSFAVASCCEPDILLIDEFLSTADLQFREKTVGKLMDMLRQSRIVMIASHDLAFLRQFCARVIWLDKGSVKEDGPAECVIENYIQATSPQRKLGIDDLACASGS